MEITAPRQAARTDRELLEQLNAGYIRAVDARDAGWFDEHLAPDFLNTNPDGSFVDRAAFLRQVAAGVGVSGIEAHDVLVRIMGDFAIIHARTSYTTARGTPGTGRYTDIWSRQPAGWLCVAAQVARSA